MSSIQSFDSSFPIANFLWRNLDIQSVSSVISEKKEKEKEGHHKAYLITEVGLLRLANTYKMVLQKPMVELMIFYLQLRKHNCCWTNQLPQT